MTVTSHQRDHGFFWLKDLSSLSRGMKFMTIPEVLGDGVSRYSGFEAGKAQRLAERPVQGQTEPYRANRPNQVLRRTQKDQLSASSRLPKLN
jgi:hypothetical protein